MINKLIKRHRHFSHINPNWHQKKTPDTQKFSINNLESNIMLPSELSLNTISHKLTLFLEWDYLVFVLLKHTALFSPKRNNMWKSQKGIRKICTENKIINKNSLLKIKNLDFPKKIFCGRRVHTRERVWGCH
jgi:hypothetical protein